MKTKPYKNTARWPLICWCGDGPMKVLRAGPERINVGRCFYICPRNLKHPQYFRWCDEWHKNDPSENKPHFLNTEPISNLSSETHFSNSSHAQHQAHCISTFPHSYSGVGDDLSYTQSSNGINRLYGTNTDPNGVYNVALLCLLTCVANLFAFFIMCIAVFAYYLGRDTH
ncbi:hypothetical protein ACS0TY_033302 [Phlomoides rotata]